MIQFNIKQQATFAYLCAFKKMFLPSAHDLEQIHDIPYQSMVTQTYYTNLVEFIRELQNLHTDFNRDVDYATLYTTLHDLAAKIPVVVNPVKIEQDALRTFHMQFFRTLFQNDSGLHQAIHSHLGQASSHELSRIEAISQNLALHGISKPGALDFEHPDHSVNQFFSSLLGIQYNPLRENNTPYIPFDDQEGLALILRFGTQIFGFNELQPAFLNFLAVKNALSDGKSIHHLYFNLLQRDVLSLGLKGFLGSRPFESFKTEALEDMNRYGLGIGVITLPADGELFLGGFSKHKGRAFDLTQKFSIDELKQKVMESVINNLNDFHIPQHLRDMIGSHQDFANDISGLFDDAVSTIVDQETREINAEKRQAILFEFVKYRLSEYLITKINPDTVNFSCKDAIDRGGVHSLWFEFRRRFESGRAMSKEEFNMNLDSAALLVKERPVNDHRHLIWNALKEFFINNQDDEKFKNDLHWVGPWLITNYPMDQELKAILTTKGLSIQQMRIQKGYFKNIQKISTAIADSEDGYSLAPDEEENNSPSLLFTFTPATSPQRYAVDSSLNDSEDEEQRHKATPIMAY